MNSADAHYFAHIHNINIPEMPSNSIKELSGPTYDHPNEAAAADAADAVAVDEGTSATIQALFGKSYGQTSL